MFCFGVGVLLLAPPSTGSAADPARASLPESQRLRDLVADQERQIKAQARRLAVLEAVVREIAASAEKEPILRPAVYDGAASAPPARDEPRQYAQAVRTDKPPSASQRGPTPEVSGVFEAGGVLTRRGQLVFEPSFEYTNSTVNRFFFAGVEIAEGILIGDIQASDADRDSYTAAAAFRYGITSRLETELKIPYVYRNDRVTNTDFRTDSKDTREIEGSDIGDVEVALRYQLNRGLANWPVFVSGIRVKTPTGTGPFDVERDNSGIETELATGSGFWGVEGSLTGILPTDPAVFYMSVGYLWHIAQDVDKQVGTTVIGEVDPGDVLNLGFGMGFAFNEQASFNLAYKHSFVFETETQIRQVTDTVFATRSSETLDVGKFAFGLAYVVTPDTTVNLSVELGVTDDAPDVSITLRVPVRFSL